MNINLHIDRLVLDGLDVGIGHGALIKKTVEAELKGLLSAGGLAARLQSGGALPKIGAGTIELDGRENPLRVGQKIARSVYGGIGEGK